MSITSSTVSSSVASALEKAKQLSASLTDTMSLEKIQENQPIQNTVIQVTQIHLEQNIRPLPPIPEECDIKLQERQELILNQLYLTLKETMKEILNMESMNHAMKIGKLMAEIVKQVEKVSYPTGKIPGAEKREIALALGKRLVSDQAVIPHDTIRNGLVITYDLLGEQLLETLLDVSRHVNTVIQQAALSCCESIVECLKRR